MLAPADSRRGEQFTPSLTPDELAFHDAVAHNESAVIEMGYRRAGRHNA